MNYLGRLLPAALSALVLCGCRAGRVNVGLGVGMSPIPGLGVGVGVSRPLRRGEKLGPNLVVNGSFEEGEGAQGGGVGAFWETVCGGPHAEIYSLDEEVRRAGDYSQRMDSDGYRFDEGAAKCYHVDDTGRPVHHPIEGTRLGNQAIAQTLAPGAVFPGRIYRLSVYVRAEDVTEDWEWFRVGVYWLDARGEFISESRQSREQGWTGTHRWRKIEMDVQAPARADTAKIYLHHHFEHGTVWFDACTFQQVLK